MRPGGPDEVYRGNLRRFPHVSSWLGTRLLADSIPITAGTFTEADGSQIPERITLTVPLNTKRFWDPGDDPEHPLARFGQRLYVATTVITPRGAEYYTPLGWFQIQDWDISADETTVTVEATGLLQVVADDKFPRPEQPRAGGTFKSEIARLMTDGIPVEFDDALVDRACPRSFEWQDDRLAAIYSLADAWPARVLTSETGLVRFLPALGTVPDPVLTLTDGEGGVLISAPRKDSREKVYTAVVASSSTEDPDSAPVSAEYVTTSGIYAASTYGYVRRRYASPLLSTAAECKSAAQKIAEDSQRAGRVQTVTLPPDPRIQRGDSVRLIWQGVPRVGWVRGTSMPLMVDKSGTPMTMEVGLPT